MSQIIIQKHLVVLKLIKLQIKKDHYMKLIRKKVIMKKCLN